MLSFLMSSLGLLEKEAKLRLKAAPGFLLENAGFEPAMAARALAAAAGLKTMVVENRPLPQPLVIEKIEFKNDGFYYQNKTQKDFARYDSLTMLAAAAIEVFLPPKITAAELETDLLEEVRLKYFPSILKPENVRPKDPVPHPQKEIVYYADIFSAQNDLPHPASALGGCGLRLRFRHDEFDFSGLGASKTYSSTENFRLLLDELEARAFSKPLMNRAFSGIKKKTPARDFILTGLEAYEKELLWLSCIKNRNQ